MKPLTPIGSPSPLRLLNKGPEYLRRQMDGGGRGPALSAVERLEADKAKYVKSQQVINSKQEPVLAPCATPPPVPRRPLAVSGTSTPLPGSRRTPDSPYLVLGSLVIRHEDEEDAKKENRHNVGVEERNWSNTGQASPGPIVLISPLVAPHSAPLLRRSNGKRMLRPDSLVIYRQKKECKNTSGSGGEAKTYSFVRRLFQGSMRDRGRSPKMTISEERAAAQDEESRMSWTDQRDTSQETKNFIKMDHGSMSTPNSPRSPERMQHSTPEDPGDPWRPAVLRETAGLRRSKSDLRLCCSVALTDKERFFDYCGLDLEVVQRLGPENFPSGGSSVDTLSLVLRSVSSGGGPGSDASEFSRHSGVGLAEEELMEQLPSVVSIVERNARVIKWLYGCRNAVQQGPKESTV